MTRNNKFIISFFTVLFLVIGVFCYFNFNSKSNDVSAAEDWLTEWTYRKPITVTVPSCVVSSGLTCTTTTSEGDIINTFTGSGTWTVPSGVTSVDYLVVAGGGGGGGAGGGGGGAGGLKTATNFTVTPGTSPTITVGAGGGVVTNGRGTSGSNSVFGSITATGGGGGASGYTITGLNGGSGGGGSAYGGTPGTGTSGQGYAGGAGAASPGLYGGGGGGASAAGQVGTTSAGGAGGAGSTSSISGSSIVYAGGGGGYSGGAGGGGGGGAGNGSAGTNGLGGGGGGAGGGAAGGTGGSGIVIVRYLAPTLTNYQTKITVPYVSGMKADFSDLRFTSSDGTTELSYWIESYAASTSAVVWVKVPSLAVGSNTIYMYYGNSSATTTSNGDNTFVFFDDFTGTTINTSKWTKVDTPIIPTCASGGGVTCTTTTSGGYVINTFTGAGSTTWTVPSGITSIEYLVVGGGGSGGTTHSGGGGGGGVVHGTTIVSGSYDIIVGAGGVYPVPGSQSTPGNNGGDSSFGTTIIAKGGGSGAGFYACSSSPPGNGGSGGGGGSGYLGGGDCASIVGSSNQTSPLGGTGYGHSGGAAIYNAPHGGGGGGAGSSGYGSTGNWAGGAGISFDITGTSMYYGAGGGGCNYYSGVSLGGSGIGGNGADYVNNIAATSGVANTGSGGGGGFDLNGFPTKGGVGSGGSGIVIVRYLATDAPAVLTEITPVSSPTTNTTPSYTFSSTKAGTITYGGGCSSSTTSAITGNNTITFNALAAGTHSCTIAIGDSNVLTATFTIASFATYTSPNLSCTLTNESCTGTNEAIIFKIYDPAGNHAELSTQSNYSYKVCCTGAGVSNTCSGNYDTVLKLSGETNAHAEKKTLSNYTNNVCLSSSTMGATCGYSANTSCSDLGTNYVCLASISGDTNAHVGECSTYATKVCCRIIVLVDDCSAKVSSNKPIASKDVDIQLCSGADVTDTSDPCYSVCWKGTGTPDLTSSDWKCGVCHDVSNSPISCSSAAASATFAWGLPSEYAEGTNYTLIDDTTLTSANPIIRFTAQDSNRIVTLGINSMGVSCSGQNSIQLVPTWREISPF